jgi:hypothetical protein
MVLVTQSPREVHSKFVRVYCKGVLPPAEAGKKEFKPLLRGSSPLRTLQLTLFATVLC